MSLQYFDESSFWEIVKVDLNKIELQSTDSYNEELIAKVIQKIGIIECAGVALQLAIVGMGNKTYGNVKIDGEIIDVKDFFRRNKINPDYKLNDKINDDELTPRRLVRFFRFLIHSYLEKNEACSSYLYKKYCIEKNETLRKFIFPGVEHYIDPETPNANKIVKSLLATYELLDTRNSTRISERIVRALQAKGFTIHA